MFGKNEVTSRVENEPNTLLVNSIFYTLQGEGPFAGCPAVFVRLAKCNLRCHFCDTEFERGNTHTIESIVQAVLTLSRTRTDLVVLTGGEPLIQDNVVDLIRALNLEGIRVQVETAGTVFPDRGWVVFGPGMNTIVCSPKTPKLNEGIRGTLSALKYVLSADGVDPDDGLPNASTQLHGKPERLFRPSQLGRIVPVYVSPMDEGDPIKNEANVRAAVHSALTFGHRLSIQIHKLPGVLLP